MESPPQEPTKALTGQALLAYYCAARRAGQSPYDESWFAPHFSTWRKGRPRPRDASGRQETIFDELVRLGVLKKVEGPIRRDTGATRIEQLNLPDRRGPLYIHGKVLSCTANVYNRKDGSGQFVRVRHEIATKPVTIEYEQVLDPARDTGVKVEGGVLVAYPSIPEDTVVTLRVAPESIREYKGKVRVSRAERVA